MSAAAAASLSSSISNPDPCCWYVPSAVDGPDKLFGELMTQSKTDEFKKLVWTFDACRRQCNAINFKFPLEANHSVFAKVLYIGAQQPQRFIPSALDCKLIGKIPKGFTREVKFRGEKHPNKEHVLIDIGSDSVMIVQAHEEAAVLGRVIMEKDGIGTWYFEGAFLFNYSLEQTEIDYRMEHCKGTFSHMHDFAKKPDDVVKACTALQLH